MLALLAGMAFAPNAISAEPWYATEVRGTVLSLENGQWLELPTGDSVGLGVPVRTLQSGRVDLTSDGIKLELAPVTALQIDQAAGSTTVVTQFAGTVSITANINEGSYLVLQTPSMSVTVKSGYTELLVDGDAGTVEVDAGVVTLQDLATGAQQEIAAGEATSVADVGTSVMASSNPVPRGNGPGEVGGNANVGGNPTAGAGGNGTGGAGGNGTGGADGNGSANGGNTGGSGSSGGNSNAGGNGNAGGNSNAGGNGNAGGSGNAGGNGNAEGNGSTGNNNSGSAGNNNGGGNGNGKKN